MDDARLAMDAHGLKTAAQRWRPPGGRRRRVKHVPALGEPDSEALRNLRREFGAGWVQVAGVVLDDV